jgi:hypothetical protein
VAALVGAVAGEHVATASSRLAAGVAATVLAGYGVAALVDRDGAGRDAAGGAGAVSDRAGGDGARDGAEGGAGAARAAVPSGRGLGVALPVALSMDNLVAGLGLGVLGVPVPVSVLALGAASAAMAAAGVAVGRRLGARRVPSERVAGVTMLAVAVLLAAGVRG